MDAAQPILDGVFSEGQIETLFIKALEREDELDGWLERSSAEADRLLCDAVRAAKPKWSSQKLQLEAGRLRRILEQALFSRLKARACHRGSEALRSTASDLRLIAAEREKLAALRQHLEARPEGRELLENLCGHNWDGSFADLRSSLRAQADTMDRLARGLHVGDLLKTEDPMRDMPELVRCIERELPQNSFMRESLPRLLNRYQERREAERDAFTEWKGLCSASLSLAGGLGGIFSSVSRLYSLGTNALDSRDAGDRYNGATARANAAFLSGGATAADYRRSLERRDAVGSADNAAVWLSWLSLAGGSRLAGRDKAAIKLTTTLLKAAAASAQPFGPRPDAPERLDRFIHCLAQNPQDAPMRHKQSRFSCGG